MTTAENTHTNLADSGEIFLLPDAQLERWNSKIQKGERGACWVWIGGRGENGYGHFWCSGRTRLSHRIAYRIYKGPIPDGMLVCHSCDNPPCVNPAHLWLGTHDDNIQDKINKGRQATGDIITSRRISPRGNNHWKHRMPALITAENADEIRAEYSSGGVSQREIGARLGLNQPQLVRLFVT